MLLNKEWSEAQEMRVVLQEPQYCCDHFQKFLSFFYSGKISIGVNECLAILCLAEKYNVKVGLNLPSFQTFIKNTH